MKEFSYQVNQSIRTFERIIKETGGEVYISGGDNILAFVKDNYVNNIIQLVNELNSKKTFSFSVGLAYTIQDVYLALKYCKSNSAGKIIMAVAEHGKTTFKLINGKL
jgi:GTP cyclohydrolase III